MQIQILQWLLIAFIILILLVCKTKGLRSLLSLGVSVVVLVKIILPLILRGYNPLLVVFVAAVPIFLLIIYLTEGFTKISHISSVAVLGNFLFTSALAWAVIKAANLSGLTSEEEAYIVGYGAHSINLPNLLIAGIMIGTVGILVEMVVTQVTTVAEVMQTGGLSKKQAFSQAYNIGSAHLGSMINTLFLIYAGVSLPILIILVGRYSSVADLLHSELAVTEIIRTIIGTIGVIIAMPSSTVLAIWWFYRGKKEV